MARSCGVRCEFVNHGRGFTTKSWNTKSLNPFRTAVSFWGQSSQISSSFVPKRDCGSKGVKLDPTIVDLLPRRSLELSLGNEPSMDEMMEALEGISNWKYVGPCGLPAELLEIDHPAFAQCFHNILANGWVPGEAPHHWTYAIIKVLHKNKNRTDCNNYSGI